MSIRRLKNLIYWLPAESAIAIELQQAPHSTTYSPKRSSTRQELKDFFGASAIPVKS